ncbi:hypothetical protein LSTR_LSTR011555 [Laodelphax striatellus]|uniref:Uncharacterized protein n=1 Tax=Laodelphax striatellus TaxID=195883 RepID=A0A482XLT7_LAOST|nr:hypothetical protein LSTR_LSTR011555 [Laodelphax striatellus]
MKASFYEIFKSEDDDIEEEEDSGSKSTTQSTTSGDISSSEQEVDDLVSKFSNSSSLSDVNNNDNRGRGRTSKTSVRLPPHRRKEEVGEPVEAATAVVEKKEGIVFADLIRKREQRKSQAPPVENVKRRTISELLADPGWNEKPKGETATPPPKCRNAVMAQFLPKNEAETESRGASPPISLIPDDKVPVARRLMDSFVPPEEPKPRQFTLEDFIIKTSPKKNSKK